MKINIRSQVITFPILNWTNEFKSETAERRLLREHSRDSKNSFGSFEMGNVIIGLKTVIAVQRRGLLHGSKTHLSCNIRLTERHGEERNRRGHPLLTSIAALTMFVSNDVFSLN